MGKTSRIIAQGAMDIGKVLPLVFFLAMAGCNHSDEAASDRSDKAAGDVVGRRIEFKAGGGSEPYRVSGWSKTEEGFTWSEGTSAKLALPVSSSPGGLRLKVTTAALIHPPDLPFQPVEVYANGRKIADWQVGNTAEFAADIPADTIKGGGTLAIEFRIPKATSPESIGLNQDRRVLGISVHALELVKL